jgi:pimeloyl-ACP methyl ester carboxylesterase
VATFALIHRGGGSAWDWHLVAPVLREHGHDALAVDLPGEDESAGWEEYADAVVEALGDRRGVVVVGHSLGAFTAPLVVASPRRVRSWRHLAEIGQLGDRLAQLAPRLAASEGEPGTHPGLRQAMGSPARPRRAGPAGPVVDGGPVEHHDRVVSEATKALGRHGGERRLRGSRGHDDHPIRQRRRSSAQ